TVRTTSEQLERRTVMNNVAAGNEYLSRKIRFVKIFYDSSFHLAADRRNVYAFKRRRALQELSLAHSFRLALCVQIDECRQVDLSLPNHYRVEKVGDWRRIDHTRSSRDYQRIFLSSVLSVKRNSRQIHHVKNVGISQLKTYRKSHYIEIGELSARFE